MAVIHIAVILFSFPGFSQDLSKMSAKYGITCEQKKMIVAVKAGSCLNCLVSLKNVIHSVPHVILVLSGVRNREAPFYLREQLHIPENEIRSLKIICDDSLFGILSVDGFHTLSIVENCLIKETINLAYDEEVDKVIREYTNNSITGTNVTDSTVLQESEIFVLSDLSKVKPIGENRIVLLNQVLHKLAISDAGSGKLIKILTMDSAKEITIQSEYFDRVLKPLPNMISYTSYKKLIQQNQLHIYPINMDVFNGMVHVFYQIEYLEMIDSQSFYKRYGVCLMTLDSNGNEISKYYMLRNSGSRPDCFTESGLTFGFNCIAEDYYKIQISCDPVHPDNSKNFIYAYYRGIKKTGELSFEKYAQQIVPNEHAKTNIYYNYILANNISFNHSSYNIISSLPAIFDSSGKVIVYLDTLFHFLKGDSLIDYLKNNYFYPITSTNPQKMYVTYLNWIAGTKSILIISDKLKVIRQVYMNKLHKSDIIQFEKNGFIFYTGLRGEDFFLFKHKNAE